ncbi:MAG: hypothetical protein Q9228_002414, partial [Teloschistes exilis]
MCDFAIRDAYPQAADFSVDEDDGEEADLDIDSDTSDADLLELKQELEKLGTKKARRDLADATIAAQEMTLRRWERDPMIFLKACTINAFRGYLFWYRKNHPRAVRLNTYESVWKALRQLYYDTCHKVVDDDVGKEITNYLHGKFCDQHSLIRGMRPKHVVGHNGLHGTLYYHWKFDTEIFALELERVELAAGLLFLAFTGARPGAIFESGCKGIAGTNAALLYKDVKLRLLQPPDEASLLVLEVTITLDKGKRKRGAPLHDFVSPDGRITIDFAFKDDILEIPIFRRSTRSIEGIHVDPRLALSANSISSWTKRLGQRAGFSHPFQPYALRRDVGTELTDRGVSDQQRNQILGHARSDTFLKHYISSNVVVDVQATFLGTASRADLIKEIGKLCLRRDPNLPKQLSDHQRTQACQRPDIIRIQQEKDALAQKLKNDFGTIKNGSQSIDGIQYTRVKNKLRASKMLAEREAFTKLLRDFHSTADLDHMVTELNGEEPASQMLDPVQHILEERRQLAHDLFQPAAVSSFAQMVETMARLCLLSEGKDHRYSGHKGDNADRTIASYACTQPSSAAVDEHVYSADSIDLTLDLNGVQPLENAKPTKTVKSTIAMKLATSSK